MSMMNVPSVIDECLPVMLIPLIPLLGSLLTYVLSSVIGKFFSKGADTPSDFSGWIASLFSLASFGVTAVLTRSLLVNDGTGPLAYRWNAGSWINTGLANVAVTSTSTNNGFSIDLAFQMDHLAAVMALVVTGVGTLIHFYAIGYMHEDREKPRFFAYLNLFMFAMLTLVLADNLLVMFIGWEGVGVCSYLLIGFWYREMQNAVAGQKAFVVNRIGDFGFILGIFLLISFCHTVNFGELPDRVAAMPLWALELAALCLFIGAVGKSAQIPLYVWLPDAMAGPTPVSALIHAATMVTAGVYMTTRMSFLFSLAPTVLILITLIGTATAFVAATIALVQFDIKKVLAYSTVSQLGFMFMALGAGAFSNGIYHVVTHAFFKACLFMSAGSVIIGCHHEQDMRRFGGLSRLMPLTALCYFCATLAISGIPFTSGFYSKDAILWTVFSSPTLNAISLGAGVTLAHAIWALGLFTAFLTAFYMTRSFVLTFMGSYRGHSHPHESPYVVTVPLIVLGSLSLVFGYMCGESLLHFLSAWTRADLLGGSEAFEHNETYHHLELLSMVVAVSAMAISWLVFSKGQAFASSVARSFRPVYRFLQNKWLVDELYEVAICKPLAFFSQVLFRLVDRILIDGLIDRGGDVAMAGGEVVNSFQVGKLGVYALVMLSGSGLILVCFFL